MSIKQEIIVCGLTNSECPRPPAWKGMCGTPRNGLPGRQYNGEVCETAQPFLEYTADKGGRVVGVNQVAYAYLQDAEKPCGGIDTGNVLR
jgi:hypothetical protein